MALKPKITIEELIRILNESKDLSDSETAKILNKDYTTAKYGKEFTSTNVQGARYALDIATNTSKETLGAKKIEKKPCMYALMSLPTWKKEQRNYM